MKYKIDQSRRIDLYPNWADCPECWRNFIVSLELRDDSFGTGRTRTINAALVEYNATRELEGHDRAVFFATPESKTWFIMRWS